MSHFTSAELQAAMNKRYVLDLLERVAWTFLQAFLAQLVASGFFSVDNVTDLSILQKAGIAGIAAVLSFVKGLVARQIGSPYTAATLDESEDTPRP
jgi:Putative lactococcus lactis phage r1t holin